MKVPSAALLTVVCLSASPRPALSDWTSVTPGIDYQQYALTMSDGQPNNVFVTRMDRSNLNCIIDSSIAQGQLRGITRETVSGMATRYDDTINYWGQSWGQRSDVVVAINGAGYYSTIPGPTNGQIITGWQAKRWDEYSLSGFVWKLDRSCFLGGDVRNSAYQAIYFANNNSVSPTSVNLARAGGNELIVYTPQFASNTYTDSTGTEVVVEMTRPLLELPLGGPSYVYGTIKQIRQNAGSTPIPFDHVVLSGTGTYTTTLVNNCVVGDQIRFQFHIQDYGTGGTVPTPSRDWTKAYAGIGCFAYVVKDGVVPTGDWEPGNGSDIRNPRTCVAFNDNYVYFLVCDGRSAASVGMTYPELGNFCINTLGANWATNQDGGGSSAIWVNGQIKNVPSDGSQRAVANGLMMVVVQPKVQSTTFSVAQVVTTNASANVRVGPGTNYGIVTTLASGVQGSVLSHSLNGVLAKGYNWWKVDFGSGTVGWVTESLLVGGGIAPTITTQPESQTIAVGGTASFTVAASGSPTLAYQWQKNSTNLTNGGHYSGATSTTLTVSTADINDVANYRCVVTNSHGTATSNDAALTLSGTPSITQQPLPQNVCSGGTATFNVAASGVGTLTYQWQKNGANVSDGAHYSGATTTTLAVLNVDSGDAGDYRCVVTNEAGSTNSNQAPLTLGLVYAFVGMGGTNSNMTGVSTDGSVAAGNNSAGGFIWSPANGLKTLGAGTSTAGAANQGSTVIVGGLNGGVASRWDGTTAGSGTWTALPAISPAFTPLCTSASASNVWVGGHSGSTDGNRKAARYKASSNSTTNLELSQITSSNPDSFVYGISDVGSYAGRYQYGAATPSGSRQAMGGSTLAALWPLIGSPSTSNDGVANSISRDGTKAGGWSKSSGYSRQGTIWTIASPALPSAVPFVGSDNYGEIEALNSNGSVAGGYGSVGGAGKHAIIWDATNGTRDLQSWLASQYGISLTGWTLTTVKGMSGDGKVIVGNGTHNGSAEGWVVLLGVAGAAPAITQQPAAQTICTGGSTGFTVAATGLGTLNYQWQKGETNLVNGGHYSGATTSTLTISGADSSDAASYRCVVSAGCNSTTSNAVLLTVKAPTTITQQPLAQNVCPGAGAQFTVTATGDGTVTYQWRKDGNNLSDDGDFSGATTATLTVAHGDANTGSYDCVATAGCGAATSNPAALAAKTVTSITQQPAAVAGFVGITVQFSVEAAGSGTFSYQWQKNDVDLSDGGHCAGATTAILTISGLDGGDAADYRCIVAADCGTATSNEAELTVSPIVPPDFNQDGHVDSSDFSVFAACASGPRVPYTGDCGKADFDVDTDVDTDDFGVFQRCYSGPAQLATPNCAN